MRRSILALLAVTAACGPAAGDFGSQCSSDSACTTGACLTTFSGGYCSQRCEETACPAGTRCAALASGSYCLQDCSIGFLDCRSEYQCVDVSAGSVCLPGCQTNADCGEGAVCTEGKCQAGTPGAVGAACLINAGCATGRCEVAFNGGMCTQTCAQSGAGTGSFDTSCDTGAVCAAVSEAGGFCHATCSTDAECREGYRCDGQVCRSRCRGAANCGLGYTCDASNGACVEGSARPRQTGAKCATDADCDSQYCLDQPNQQFPGGVCSDDCTSSASVCGTAGACIVPNDPQFASVCLQSCSNNFDCRADYFCSAVVNSPSQRVCLPRCTAVSLCQAPEVCDQFSGDCEAPGAAGTSSIVRLPLGDFAISGTSTTKDYALEVPADAVSFTLVLKGKSGGVGGTSVVSRLTSPTGELLFDLDNYLSSKVRILPVNDGDFGMLFPNSPRVPIQAGTYRFSVLNENGAGTGEVFALVKKSTSPTLNGGKLNLNFWFAGLSPLTAATAATDPSFQSALTEFRTLYQTAGIQLGTVSYFDVPAAQANAFSVIDTTEGKDSELRKLFEISAGAPNNAMNFFMVEEIKGGGAGFTILGIAGGIPGIPFEQGTNASGVAVTAVNLSMDPKSVARTMAHEGGHWLGLWHTTEQNGTMHDPLGDTPECPASRDANKDKILTSSECVNTGAEMLMFWQAGDTASQLTGNQGFVLQRNPVVSQ